MALEINHTPPPGVGLATSYNSGSGALAAAAAGGCATGRGRLGEKFSGGWIDMHDDASRFFARHEVRLHRVGSSRRVKLRLLILRADAPVLQRLSAPARWRHTRTAIKTARVSSPALRQSLDCLILFSSVLQRYFL